MHFDQNKELRSARKAHLKAGITPALFEMDGLRLTEARMSHDLETVPFKPLTQAPGTLWGMLAKAVPSVARAVWSVFERKTPAIR